jgi:hypothetical protein
MVETEYEGLNSMIDRQLIYTWLNNPQLQLQTTPYTKSGICNNMKRKPTS